MKSKSGFALERDSITAMTETHDMDLRVHFSCVSFERKKKTKTRRRRDETGFVHVEGKLYKGKRK